MAMMSSRSVVNLESTALLVQQSRYQNRLNEGPRLVRELLTLCEEQMDIESKKEADPRMSRARRQVFLSRRNELVGRFRAYAEMLRMSLEEYNMRVYLHYKIRQWNFSRVSYFLQPLESCLSTLTEKLRRRMEGYTQQIVDSLQAENATTQSLYARIMSERIWRVHRMVCEFVDSGTAPTISELLEFLPLQEEAETPIILHEVMYMIHCLQLVEVLCSRSSDGEDGMSLVDSMRIGSRSRTIKSQQRAPVQSPSTHRSIASTVDDVLSRVTIPALAAQLVVAAFRMLKSVKRACRSEQAQKQQPKDMTIGGVEGGDQCRELSQGAQKKRGIIVSALLNQTFRTLKSVLQTKEAAERFVNRSSFLIKTPGPVIPMPGGSIAAAHSASQTGGTGRRRSQHQQTTKASVSASTSRSRRGNKLDDGDDENDDNATGGKINHSNRQQGRQQQPLVNPSMLPSSLQQHGQSNNGKHNNQNQVRKSSNAGRLDAVAAASAAAAALGLSTYQPAGTPHEHGHGASSGAAGRIGGGRPTTGTGMGGHGKQSAHANAVSANRSSSDSDDDGENNHHNNKSNKNKKQPPLPQQPEVSDKFWGKDYDIMALAVDVVTWMQVVVAARAGGRDLIVLVEPSDDEQDGVIKRKEKKRQDILPEGVSEDFGEFKNVLLQLDEQLVATGSQFVTNLQFCANRIIRAMIDPHASLASEFTKDHLVDVADATLAATTSAPWRLRQSAIIRRSLNSLNKTHFSVLPKLYGYPVVYDLVQVSTELGFIVTESFRRFLAPNGKTSYPFVGDTLVIREIEKEATEALKLISAASSCGYITRCSAATILEAGKLAQHRTMNYFLIHAWLQNLHAAVANVLFSADGTTEDTYDRKTGLVDISGTDISTYATYECKHVDRTRPYDAMSKFISQRALQSITHKVTLKESLRSYLGGSIANIFLIMSNHRSSVSIVHSSLLLLRLIFRDVFVKRAVLDDFMGVESASDYVLTTENVGADNLGVSMHHKKGDASGSGGAEEGGTGGDAAASAMTPRAPLRRTGTMKGKFKPNMQDSTVSITTEGDAHEIADPWSISQSNSKADSSGGDGEPGSETKEYFEKWKQGACQHVLGDFQDSGLRELTFPELMAFIGETHILCDELMEQYLLFIQHLAGISGVCKLALVEAGVPPVLQRILEAKKETKNVFLISLCEICLEDLNVDMLNVIY